MFQPLSSQHPDGRNQTLTLVITPNQLAKNWRVSAVSAVGCALVGLLSLLLPGGPFTNWSYDLLFALRSNITPDEAVIVYMDDESHRSLNQPWFQGWDRAIHAQLIEKLSALGARTIAFDILFDLPNTNHPAADERLVKAAASHGKVIVAGKITPIIVNGEIVGGAPTPPFDKLRSAVQWGLVESGDGDRVIRLHASRFLDVDTLAWKVAQSVPTNHLYRASTERWLNYYGPPGTVPWVSYHQVLDTNFLASESFSNKVAYVGALYNVGFTGGKGTDDFRTPYSLWTNRRSPGVEINATACLNLLRGDWLTRVSFWIEAVLIALLGLVLGGALTRLRPRYAAALGVLCAVIVLITSWFLAWRYHTLFPWLVVAGVQIPVGILGAAFARARRLAHEKGELESLLTGAKAGTPPPIVQFTVTSTVAPPRGSLQSVEVIVWAHQETEREQVLKWAREVSFDTEITHLRKPTGTNLVIKMALEGVTSRDLQESIVWDGTVSKAKFAIETDANRLREAKRGVATVYVLGLKIATLHFHVTSQADEGAKAVATVQDRPRKAFASYSSADRDEVLARIQGMQIANPQLEVFLDVLSLRSGQNWDEELRKAIRSHDCFYLFWSRNARASKEVEREWRFALQERGRDFIEPVPLEAPDQAPPPSELCDKHFNDWTLAFKRGQTKSEVTTVKP